jgi:hypothetical protein
MNNAIGVARAAVVAVILPQAVAAWVLLMVSSTSADNMLVNGGFETVVSTTLPSHFPTDVGYWTGDGSAIVTAADDISPCEGTHMLHFIWASSQHQASYFFASEVLQVVDLGSFDSLISQGRASAVVSACFNRVAGDAETDTMFGIRLYAFSGAANTFFDQYEGSNWLCTDTCTIVTDSDASTWETATLVMPLPLDTDFASITVFASENVYNDLSGLEFDGHYGDDVRLEVTPEPATLSLLALGGAAVMARRRKKN